LWLLPHPLLLIVPAPLLLLAILSVMLMPLRMRCLKIALLPPLPGEGLAMMRRAFLIPVRISAPILVSMFLEGLVFLLITPLVLVAVAV
jgi:hypothetical protein